MSRGHHVLFTRPTWSSQETTKHLRNHHWLIVPLHNAEHQALHNAVTTVPLLDHQTAKRVDRDYHPIRGSYIGSVFELMHVIEDAFKHPRASELEKALGQLTVHALEMQIPFIREGLDVQ